MATFLQEPMCAIHQARPIAPLPARDAQFSSRSGSYCLVTYNALTSILQPQPLHPGQVHGQAVLPLHEFGGITSALVRWDMITQFTTHVHPGGEEILVLQGLFQDEHGEYPAGTWLRSPCRGASTLLARRQREPSCLSRSATFARNYILQTQSSGAMPV